MKQISFFAIVLAAVAAFSVSCSKDDDKDTTKPVIVLHEPADGDTLFIGHEVHLEVEISDNVKLKSYKVDIHSNFDGHVHTKGANADVAWSFNKSWDISGLKNTHIHHHEIIVPTHINGSPIAKGNYHFSVYATDEAGNESHVVVSVVVWDGEPHED
jgi:hypothetical protein